MARDRDMAPGQRVLLLCAAASPRREAIVAAASLVTDWNSMCDLAARHKLLLLLADAVEKARIAVPPAIATRFRDAILDSAGRAMLASITLRCLLNLLREEGIQVCPLKGPTLAELLYPDPVLRPFSDLDLVVRSKDVPLALEVFAREGYTIAGPLARLPVRQILTFMGEALLQKDGALPVDLHWELLPAGFPYRLDPKILWGAEPSLEALLLYLCVHGTKHMWSRLGWLADVARLACLHPDWTQAIELASREGCLRPVLLGLLLAYDLLDADVPEWIVERARVEHGMPQLAQRVVSRLLAIPTKRNPDRPEQVAFNASMAENPWRRARCYIAMVLAPMEPDLEMFRLPRRLSFLYCPLRICRLTAKYAFGRTRR